MIKFGTGGWRAYIGEEFTRENVELVAQAIASLKPKTSIALGYDRRFLSEKAVLWVANVLIANGIKVRLSNSPTATPSVMLMVKHEKLDYGMAITASHNPYDFNGIKVFIKGGKDADVIFTAKLEQMLSKGLKVKKIGDNEVLTHKLVKVMDFNQYYANHLPSILDMDLIKNSKLKVIIDPMNGVSRLTLEPTLSNGKFKPMFINDEYNPSFKGRVPAPTSSNLDELKNKVLKENYDLGIALDGDGDRIGIYDNLGNYLDANRLLAILYYYFLEYEHKKGNIVRNLCTTTILDKIASKYGYQAIETKVGFKYISAGMNNHRALLGGESSGGLTMLGHIDGKDSIFATLLIIQMLTKSKKKISDLIQEVDTKFGVSYIGDENFKFSPAQKKLLETKVMKKKLVPLLPFKVVKTQYIDGLKLDFEHGYWVSLRFSGTEPLLRLYYEVKDKKMATQVVAIFKSFYQL